MTVFELIYMTVLPSMWWRDLATCIGLFCRAELYL